MLSEYTEQDNYSWRPKKGVITELPRPYEPWGPTPGKPYSLEVADCQAEANTQAERMLSSELRPSFVGDELASFVYLVHLSREANRATENALSYSSVLPCNREVKTKLERAELGQAEPNEITELLNETRIGSAELAHLTHIYGYRLEHWHGMRDCIDEMISRKGGEFYPNAEPTYGIVALDSAVTGAPSLSEAIAFTKKEVIGHIEDTVIHERTTFIVRLDRMSPEVASFLKSIPSCDLIGIEQQIMQNGGLSQELTRLLALNDFESVIPMSTTIFACSATNRERIQAVFREEQRIINEEVDIKMPQSRLHQKMLGAIASGSWVAQIQ